MQRLITLDIVNALIYQNISLFVKILYFNYSIILSDISPNTAELLFEVYDRHLNKEPTSPTNGTKTGDSQAEPMGPKFLGLGLVGVDELAVGPASCQILTLQPKPYEQEKVFGAITVEVLLLQIIR